MESEKNNMEEKPRFIEQMASQDNIPYYYYLFRSLDKASNPHIPRVRKPSTQAWTYQKKLKSIKDVPTPGDIVLMARSIKNDRDRALFIIMYLTAARVSEVANTLYRKDITLQEINYRQIVLFKLHNRKHKTRNFKDIPVPLDKEKDLLEMLLPWLETKELDARLFPFSNTRAYQIIRKTTGMNPHWIRHLRLTHLSVYYDFNDQLLVRFAGWTDSRPAKNYMEMRWTDILQKY